MAYKQMQGEVSSTFVKWPNGAFGTKFVGVFKGISSKDINGKAVASALFTDAEGRTVRVSLPTILHSILANAEAGEVLRIVYTADAKAQPGKSAAKLFDVKCFDSLSEAVAFNGEAAPQAQAPQETEAEKQARLFAAFLASQKQETAPPTASEYEGLVAKLKAKDEKGAPALLMALEQIYKSEPDRVAALRSHLKAQGVAV
jgi:hypothetical protein